MVELDKPEVQNKDPFVVERDSSNSEKILKEDQASTEGSYSALILALVIGFSGVIGISFFVPWYESIVTNSYYSPLVAVAIPPVVFSLLFLVVIFNNTLLAKILPSLWLHKREMLIILSLWLMTSVVCYVSMIQPITQLIGTAYNNDIAKPTTKRVAFQQYLNSDLFLNSKDSNKYYYGIGNGVNRVSLSEIPWSAWLGPMKFWIPFMIFATILSVSLVRIMHRQWSKHELLTYPLADFSSSLLDCEKTGSLPKIFYNKMFISGIIFVSIIFLINGIHSYFPLMVQIPMSFYHISIIKHFPFIQKYCGREGYSLFRGMLYPLVVAIVVLLPSEISFSCWAGWIFMVLGTGFYFLVSGEVIGATETGFLQAGMYITMFGAIIFVGRKEYLSIIRHTFLFKKSEDVFINSAVKACRVFIAAFVLMFISLKIAGMDTLTALCFVASFSIVIVLMARFTAEIGIPWLVNFNGKSTYLPMTMLGTAAIGPQSIAILLTVGAVFSIGLGTANTIAIQETTVEKVAEKAIAPSFKKWFNLILLSGLVLAIVFSLIATLSNSYSFGLKNTTWANQIDTASKKISKLNIEGISKKVSNIGFFEKFNYIQADPGFWRFFVLGAIIVGLCMFMRLRFTWWHLHPLPLLLLNEWCLSRLYFSFLIGWLIKTAILRIGGGKVFTAIKPFCMGVIIGQCLISAFWIIINSFYYLTMDTSPPPFNIFP